MDSPTKVGQVAYHHFDSVFFGVNLKLAINIDPTAKIGYVCSYEAVLDAGMSTSIPPTRFG